MYFVYILESNNSNRHYIGCSDNVERRLAEHNKGKVSSTRAFVPWKVVYTEVFENKSQAFSREKEIKSYKSGFKFKELQKTESWQSPRIRGKGCLSRFAGNAAVEYVFCIHS